MEDNLYLELFNLEKEDISSCKSSVNQDCITLDVFLMNKSIPCPDCGYDKPKIKGYEVKKITHSTLVKRKCVLLYHARRYRCPICNRTYYEHNPFVFGSMKISALTVMNVLNDLKNYNETFSSVAKRHHISPTSIASIFDSHVSMPRLTLPEYMNIDECYAFHSYGENSKYVCMFIDYLTGNPIDLLPSRRQDYLIKYFRDIPKEERNQVKMIASDMYEPYRNVIKTVFPNALHIVDRYHLVQELTRRVDAIRLRVMKTYAHDKSSHEYYVLKNFNWLIFKRFDSKDKKGELFDPNRKKEYNNHFRGYRNYYDIKQFIRDIHPDLKTAWNIKDEFVDLYENNTIDTIEESLNLYIQELMNCSIPEINHFGKTIKKWKKEIINSFIVVKQTYQVEKDTGRVVVSNHRLSNGLMENRNSILKCIKKNANGYTNWSRFRNRCLYVLRKEAVPRLNPIQQEKK